MSIVSQRNGHEQAAIHNIAARLAREFTGFPVAEIGRTVARKYMTFDDAPVRDFVPVLVERAARDELKHTSP